jgi:hypothetical protein
VYAGPIDVVCQRECKGSKTLLVRQHLLNNY